jgi:hypothetical protein
VGPRRHDGGRDRGGLGLQLDGLAGRRLPDEQSCGSHRIHRLRLRAAHWHAKDPRYAFGTWKIEVLGGFASAFFLLGVVVLMAYGSIERLIKPEPIRHQEAMLVAV